MEGSEVNAGGEALAPVRYGGSEGRTMRVVDQRDLVVVRTRRRGARHDVSPLARRTREAHEELTPCFGFSAAGVGVYTVEEGRSEELSDVIDADPEVEFAGRGLRDEDGAPIVYTENLFVKFLDDADPVACEQVLLEGDLTVKRPLGYAKNAFFAGAEARTGRTIFTMAEQLLGHGDVELCHPEIVREISWNRAFPQQWHLHACDVGGVPIDQHASVAAAWPMSRGEGIVIAVIDDGVDIDHAEFAADGKIVAPWSVTPPRTDDPRPGEGRNHGTACAGVACANGDVGASGVAPLARLLPMRFDSGLGSQDEADAFVWATDHGADVISCSWGPTDGKWWNPADPAHQQSVPLPDNTRLAIDYAIEKGRDGRGCVITWAAGNGNEDVGNDGYASYEKVIAVAACNDFGRKSAYSDFGDAILCCFPSNHGEPSQTPGIWTTDRAGTDGYNAGSATLGDSAGDFTNSFGGTSSACPGVAGVVALVLSRNAELTWEQVKDLLARSCDRIDDVPGEYDENGRSAKYGFGRVNAARAVQLADPDQPA